MISKGRMSKRWRQASERSLLERVREGCLGMAVIHLEAPGAEQAVMMWAVRRDEGVREEGARRGVSKW